MFLTVGSAAALKEIAPWLRQAVVSTSWRRKVLLFAWIGKIWFDLANTLTEEQQQNMMTTICGDASV